MKTAEWTRIVSLAGMLGAGCGVPPNAGGESASLSARAPVERPQGGLRMQALQVVSADASAFHAVEAGAFRSSLGPKLAARVDERGLSFEARPVSLRLAGYGRAGAVREVGAVAPALSDCLAPAPDGLECARRTELRRDGLIEWYRPALRGMEQGFDLAERPAGEGRLAFALALAGAATVTRNTGGTPGAAIVDEEGQRWALAQIHAWDADRVELPADLEVGEDGLRLTVDDRSARYPITVDPTVTWTYNGENAGDEFGYAMVGGDFNGDGYGDVAVAAPDYNNFNGRVYVFHGSSSGLSYSQALDSMSSNGHFGFSLAAADVNGDGCDDLVVGAPYVDIKQTSVLWWFNAGRVYLYLGVNNGTLTYQGHYDDSDTGTENGTVIQPDGELYGWSVANAGDVNHDGYDDVLVGAPGLTEGSSYQGRWVLFKGSSGGSLSKWIADTNTGTDKSANYRAQYGYAVAGIGDINGDGHDDFAVSSPYYGSDAQGKVSVYLGGTTSASVMRWAEYYGTTSNEEFGLTLAGAGDASGDGRPDFLVGSPTYTNGSYTNSGRVTLYYSCHTGIVNGSPTLSCANATHTGSHTGGLMGSSLVALGDLDGDGFGEFALGTPGYDDGKFEVHTGVFANSYATYTMTSGTSDFGSSLAAADVNGDGVKELIVGAPTQTNGSAANSGGAWVFSF